MSIFPEDDSLHRKLRKLSVPTITYGRAMRRKDKPEHGESDVPKDKPEHGFGPLEDILGFKECVFYEDKQEPEYHVMGDEYLHTLNQLVELQQRTRKQRHHLEKLKESDSRLQTKYATLVKTNEELINQKCALEKIVETFRGEADTVPSLREKIKCQESCLVEKTQRILTLETSLKCVRETTKKADEICSRLKPLQSIPGLVSSHCEALSLQITDTTGKLHDYVNNSSTQLDDKINTLVKAWTGFRSKDIADEEDTKSLSQENIPKHLKRHVLLLSDTVGPNWLDAGRALGLDGDQLKRIWMEWGQYGMRELTVRVIECWCANCPESQPSVDVLETAMNQLEINPLKVLPMGEDDKRRLRENYQLLIHDMMDVTHIEGYLRRAEILSGSALDYVLHPNTCHKRIKRLLKILPFCGSRALPEFKNALMESSQSHLTLALAGEQCSASKTDSDVLVECLASNKSSNPNNSKGSLVECLKAKKSDDRKIFQSIVEESPQAEKSDDRKIFENIIDERLEAKKCEDRKVLEKVLLQCFEAKKSDDRKLFESILDERLEVKRSDDRKLFESILDERLEVKRSDDRKLFESILDERLEAKKSDDRKLFESILDERLEVKRSDDRKMFGMVLEELQETKKIDDRKVLENFLTELLETKKIDDRRSLERIDEILEPSVRVCAEIKQIIYMLIEKYEKFMSYQQTDTSAICPPNMSQKQ
ncbi:uncharacterized protein LOC135476601 isoform X2 [Liolophura sinensis]|uniref:uncharacterized protein LOC135476601 isoform X2 n=1 Tax=Liolophura sinensis TaxID=3198878 RepID=UPI0031584CF9